MTKSLFICLILLCIGFNTFANRIDDLKTDADVIKFINSLHISNDKLRLATLGEIINRHCHVSVPQSITTWKKADFNNDGRSDLIAIASVDGSQIINLVVIDTGNNNFKYFVINYSLAFQCEFITTVSQKKQQLLLFHKANFSYDVKAPVKDETIDTLIYNFNAFIEQNRHPANYHIKYVVLRSSPCFGTCPVQELDIYKTGEVRYLGGRYSKKQGTFRSKINQAKLDSLVNFINYLDIMQLKNSYAVDWTDSPTCYLTVAFDDGSVKNISDYGERGTFGLRTLYDMVWGFIPSQNWSK